MSSEVRKVERKFEKRWNDVQRLSHKEITRLWDKHDKLKGAKNNHVKQGLLGKIIGIEWVLKLFDELEHKAERDLRV